MKNESFARTRYLFALAIFIVISVGGIVFAIRFLSVEEEAHSSKQCKTSRPTEIKTSFTQDKPGDFPWWDDTYSYVKTFALENTHDSEVLSTECWVMVQFNHSELVDEKKSQEDGLDLHLVHLENNQYKVVQFALRDPNTDHTTIEFLPAQQVAPGMQDGSYFLYYSNILAATNEYIIPPPSDESSFAQVYKGYRSREFHAKVLGHVSRQWILQDPQLDDNYTTLTYTIELDSTITPLDKPIYQILGTQTQGTMNQLGLREYSVELSLRDVPPGKYQIQATVDTEAKQYRSPKTHIFVSQPLFVALTIDWEGTDVPDKNLDKLIELSNNHGKVPMTHLFNPRIYIDSATSPERAQYLTQWAQVRKLNGDEIGMHLHMWYGIPQAAGVPTKTSPRWAGLSDGHDVPCSAYSTEEFVQILTWAKNELFEQGLGIPITFRAGGWQADTKTLAALEQTGFRIDTSGREYAVWGSLALPWKLTSTTKPYHPSIKNQNSSLPSPQFGLWEFPNNGADSYVYSTDDMIKRFNDNYPRQPLTEKQTVVYLTHPHDFEKDFGKLDPLYSYLDQYKAENDAGPVVYLTLEKILRSYE